MIATVRQPHPYRDLRPYDTCLKGARTRPDLVIHALARAARFQRIAIGLACVRLLLFHSPAIASVSRLPDPVSDHVLLALGCGRGK
jgi:hypothetical protein